MTLFQYLSLIALFLCAVAMGGITVALVTRADEQQLDGVMQAAWFASASGHARDTALLDFLEKSECNLFFNTKLGVWGLLDGSDKIVATAHTVRATLARAVDKGAPKTIVHSPSGGGEVEAQHG
jgi:hypothetical protein